MNAPALRILSEARWRSVPGGGAPDVSFIPAMARRRMTALQRAFFAVAKQALDAAGIGEGEMLPVVFASRWGEIGETLKLFRQFHEEGEMSPAGFSVSVHNASPGAWSLFRGDKSAYTAIAAGETSFDDGWLEAALQARESPSGRVLFVYAEEPTPEFYRPHFPDVQEGMALARVAEIAEGR